MEVVWEAGRAIYSVGLLVLGVVVILGTPPTVRVLRDLTGALVATAAGLRAVVADKDALDHLRGAVARVEAAQLADRETLAEIKALVERVARERR